MEVSNTWSGIHLELSVPHPQQKFDSGKVFLVHIFVLLELSPITRFRQSLEETGVGDGPCIGLEIAPNVLLLSSVVRVNGDGMQFVPQAFS